MNWFHRLFNPHCPICIEENRIKLEQNNTCKTCDVLREENLFLKGQVQELQNHILHPSIPTEPIVNTEELKPITNYRKPFSVIRQELEAADKLKAKELNERIIKEQAAKPDTSSPIVNDEGKIDPKLVEQELNNIDQEINNG